MDRNANVIQLDCYRKSPLSVELSVPESSDLSFVKSSHDCGKREVKFNCWVVVPSGDYAADCLIGRRLAFEYLQYVQRASFPLQWILDDMRQYERNGVEVGFLSTVSKAASLGSSVAGDRLRELVFSS